MWRKHYDPVKISQQDSPPDLTSFHLNVLVGQPYKRVSVLAE